MIKILTVFALVASLLLSGCTSYNNFIAGFQPQGTEEKTVRIGIFEPLSGADAKYGELEKRGIELAYGLYPKILEKPVELIVEDNNSNPDYAQIAAKNLITKRASVVLGSYGSSNSMIGGVEFEKAKVPAIAITCTNPLVTSINKYYFRVCFIDTFQGLAMAKYAVTDAKAGKAAILTEDGNDFSLTLGNVFAEKFISMTGEKNSIVSSTKYAKDEDDFSSQINAIKTSNPDVVFMPGNPKEVAFFIKQARAAGIKSQFLGINSLEDQSFVRIAGEASEGTVFSTLFDPSVILNEKTTEFLNAFHKKYGPEAIPTREEVLGFDAYLVALDAINRAGTAINGDKVKEALILTQQLPGANGDITFDPNKDAVKPVVMKTIQNGEFIYKNTIVPNWG
ncbi:MAG: ABC transporter substrate-binding protein [Eubacteriales bacterium]